MLPLVGNPCFSTPWNALFSAKFNIAPVILGLVIKCNQCHYQQAIVSRIFQMFVFVVNVRRRLFFRRNIILIRPQYEPHGNEMMGSLKVAVSKPRPIKSWSPTHVLSGNNEGFPVDSGAKYKNISFLFLSKYNKAVCGDCFLYVIHIKTCM